VAKRFPKWEELRAGRRLRCRIEYAGLWTVSRLVPLLPWRGVRSLAWVLGALVYAFDRRGRAYALANLEMVFGAEKTPEELRRIARDSYRHFARTMLELFWARNFTAENYRDYMEMEGWEQARALNRTHQGGIFVCLHYGNFEWLSIAGAFEKLPGCIVTQRFRNPLLGPVFDRLRALSGHRIIAQERSMLVTLKHLKNGGNIGILFDLQLDPRHPAVPLSSFGHLRPATKIHAMLQKHTGLPVIPIESVPLPDGRYRTIAHDPLYFGPGASEAEIVQRCWDFFEPQVRRQPEAWLWAYKHWRYVPAGEDAGRYPFYAKRSADFDRLLKEEFAPGDQPDEDTL
jgi:KDO2-lipid IV(A) lauroyltransferase